MPPRTRPPGTTPRPSFTREGGVQRRDALIAATLDSIAETGTHGTTVRMIAERAGVTPGPIRHYVSTRDDRLPAACRRLMATMTKAGVAGLAGGDWSPANRLAADVSAAVSALAVDPRSVALGAGFIQPAMRNVAIRAVHAQTCLNFRNQLQSLIAADLKADSRDCADVTLRRPVMACNAVSDGLVLEGSALPDASAPGELTSSATALISRSLDLTRAGPELRRPPITEPEP